MVARLLRVPHPSVVCLGGVFRRTNPTLPVPELRVPKFASRLVPEVRVQHLDANLGGGIFSRQLSYPSGRPRLGQKKPEPGAASIFG